MNREADGIAYSGFGEALDYLDEDPFPVVLSIIPVIRVTSPETLERLVEGLRLSPKVEIAKLDVDWVKRLYAFTEFAHRAVLVLAGLLALAILLIIGNTIR